jgi:hypothetical protein
MCMHACSRRQRRSGSKLEAWQCEPEDGAGEATGLSHMHSDLRSDGLTEWKAPDAMKSMWLVFTLPCLVETVQPDDVEMVTSS